MQGFRVFVRGLLLFLKKKKTFDTPVCPKTLLKLSKHLYLGSGLGI